MLSWIGDIIFNIGNISVHHRIMLKSVKINGNIKLIKSYSK